MIFKCFKDIIYLSGSIELEPANFVAVVQKYVSVLSLEENLMTQDESHWRKALFVQTVQKDIPFTKFEDTFQITLKDSHCVA